MLDFLGDLKRTHMCGELRASDAGSKLVLMGWVNKRRDLGNLIFVDLRDRERHRPSVITPRQGREAMTGRPQYAPNLWSQSWASQAPRAKTVNKNTATARSKCCRHAHPEPLKAPPFYPRRHLLANEELRLKHRYIDLRRPVLQQNIELRPKLPSPFASTSTRRASRNRDPLHDPVDPEGARDFLVPAPSIRASSTHCPSRRNFSSRYS